MVGSCKTHLISCTGHCKARSLCTNLVSGLVCNMSTYFCETLPDGNSSASWDWKLSSFLSPKATDSFHSHPALKQKTHSLFKNVGYLPFIGCFGWKANGTLTL